MAISFPMTTAQSLMVHLSTLLRVWQCRLICSVFCSVILTVMVCESRTNPTYVRHCVGTNTDFPGWMVKPRPSSRRAVATTLFWQLSNDVPNNALSSMYAELTWPLARRCANAILSSFVNFLGPSPNPLGRDVNCHNFCPHLNLRYFLSSILIGME